MQKKQKNFQLAIIGVLAFAVLAMSVGFAAYSQTLKISGNTVNVASNKWDVHFVDPARVTVGAGLGEAPTVSATNVTFSANLQKVGDKFSFDIDVTNAGDFNAELKRITLTGLSLQQAKYLKYTVTYDGTIYDSNADVSGKPLDAQATKTATVTVEYIQPAKASELPTGPQEITLGANLDFVQV